MYVCNTSIFKFILASFPYPLYHSTYPNDSTNKIPRSIVGETMCKKKMKEQLNFSLRSGDVKMATLFCWLRDLVCIELAVKSAHYPTFFDTSVIC